MHGATAASTPAFRAGLAAIGVASAREHVRGDEARSAFEMHGRLDDEPAGACTLA